MEIEHCFFGSDGELVIELVDVIHASHKRHVLDHSFWIKSSLQTILHLSILDGSHLWDLREELFPHLQFCKDVERPLRSILPGDRMLDPIRRKLALLEQFCVNWPAGRPFEPENIGLGRNVSPESEATLNMYGDRRTFICPDGLYRRFTWHVKFNPGAWRIYFLYLEEGYLIIGYIGRHLPIVTS